MLDINVIWLVFYVILVNYTCRKIVSSQGAKSFIESLSFIPGQPWKTGIYTFTLVLLLGTMMIYGRKILHDIYHRRTFNYFACYVAAINIFRNIFIIQVYIKRVDFLFGNLTRRYLIAIKVWDYSITKQYMKKFQHAYFHALKINMGIFVSFTFNIWNSYGDSQIMQMVFFFLVNL